MSLGSQNDIIKTWLNFENSLNLFHSCSRIYRKSRLAYIPNLQIFSFANFHPCLAEESEKRETRSKRREGGIGRIKEESLIASRGKKMISSKNSPRTVVSSRLAYTRAHACQDTTEPGVETRRAALRRLVALHYYDIRHAWPALTIKPLFHLADWRGPESICQNVWCRITVTTRDFLFAFETQLRFFFQRFGNWSSLRIFNFFSSTLTRRFLRIATRISYFVRWIKARQSNWILYYTEQSWKSLWNEISCRFDGIIKIIRNFSSFFFF